MTKYKEYYQLMLTNNKELFDEFRQVHDEFALQTDPSQRLRARFNKVGEKVQAVIRTWEDKLCGRSEANGYGSYSGGLAGKFQEEIRKTFPQIDSVGIIAKTPDLFNLKKINF